MTVIPVAPNYPEESLTQIRRKLETSLASRRDDVDSLLLDKLLTDDQLIRRYMKRKNGDIEQSVTFITSVLEWRKKMGIPDLTASSFPREFYEVGGIYIFREDVEGNPVLHIRIRLFQKVEGILELLKKFSIYLMYRVDELAAEKGPEFGWVLLFDCTEASLMNADIDMANFVSSTLRNYFPSGQKYTLVFKLPWLLSAVKTLLFTMLPSYVKRKIRFCDEKSLFQHIPQENLPDYLNGPGKSSDYRIYPDGLVSTAEMVRKGVMPMNEEQFNKTNQYYQRLRKLLYPE